MLIPDLTPQLRHLQIVATPHAGKITLGALGLLTSGFWGGLCGVLAGAAADSWGNFLLKLKETKKTKQVLPQEMLLALATVAVAEGLFLPGLWRFEHTRDILRAHFYLNPSAERGIAKILLRHGSDAPVLASQLAHIRSLLLKMPEKCDSVIICLLQLARDARRHTAEIHIRSLGEIALALGVTAAKFDRLKTENVAALPDCPHALLGLEPDAAPEAASEAYRRLMLEIHPDRWQASANMFAMARAEEKAARINAAYAQIKKG